MKFITIALIAAVAADTSSLDLNKKKTTDKAAVTPTAADAKKDGDKKGPTTVTWSKERNGVMEKYNAVYDKENKMMYNDRVIFSTTLETRKKFNTLMQLEQFHKMAKLIQRRSIEYVKMFGRHHKKITKYFNSKTQLK